MTALEQICGDCERKCDVDSCYEVAVREDTIDDLRLKVEALEGRLNSTKQIKDILISMQETILAVAQCIEYDERLDDEYTALSNVFVDSYKIMRILDNDQ